MLLSSVASLFSTWWTLQLAVSCASLLQVSCDWLRQSRDHMLASDWSS